MKPTEAAPSLLDGLGSEEEAIRLQTLRELDAMPPLEACRALRGFGAGHYSRLILSRITGCLAILILLMTSGMVIVGLMFGMFDGYSFMAQALLNPIPLFGYTFAFLSIRAQLTRRRNRRTIERTLDMLSATSNRGAIGLLVRSRDLGEDSWQLNAERPLIRLLPLLQPGDQLLFTAEELHCLNKLIEEDNAELALAALGALSIIGNAQSLGECKSLRWRTRPGSRNLYPRARSLYESVNRTIEAIERRLQREEVDRTLLRPAGEPGGEADRLLRYAVWNDTEDSSLLVRSINDSETP